MIYEGYVVQCTLKVFVIHMALIKNKAVTECRLSSLELKEKYQISQ
jgi:hypothetical protein